jgi:hypothetical protein
LNLIHDNKIPQGSYCWVGSKGGNKIFFELARYVSYINFYTVIEKEIDECLSKFSVLFHERL